MDACHALPKLSIVPPPIRQACGGHRCRQSSRTIHSQAPQPRRTQGGGHEPRQIQGRHSDRLPAIRQWSRADPRRRRALQPRLWPVTEDRAIEWATRQADALGDVDIDVRPVTEPWDIGMAPAPADLSTRRFMILRKATPTTEAGGSLTDARRAKLARLIEETTSNGIHVVTETMRPSRRGRRYRNSRDGVSVYDGPFIETKEMLGGYIVVSSASIEEAEEWAAPVPPRRRSRGGRRARSSKP